MISEELKKQIEAEAADIEHCPDSDDRQVTAYNEGLNKGYIAGATKYIREFEAEANRIKRINEKYVALKDENSQLKARCIELAGMFDEEHKTRIGFAHQLAQDSKEMNRLKARIAELETLLKESNGLIDGSRIILIKMNYPDTALVLAEFLDKLGAALNTKTKW